METARFLCDDSLSHLARRLRVLGRDVECVRGRFEELADLAVREQRVLLTRSRRTRSAAGPPTLAVSGALAPDVRAVLAAHPGPLAPWTRCTSCNGVLAPRGAFEARGEVPGRVLRGAGGFRSCSQCARWYWDGTHAERLRDWFSREIGLPIDRPAPPGSP